MERGQRDRSEHMQAGARGRGLKRRGEGPRVHGGKWAISREQGVRGTKAQGEEAPYLCAWLGRDAPPAVLPTTPFKSMSENLGQLLGASRT